MSLASWPCNLILKENVRGRRKMHRDVFAARR
jgi:hypothetical protein